MVAFSPRVGCAAPESENFGLVILWEHQCNSLIFVGHQPEFGEHSAWLAVQLEESTGGIEQAVECQNSAVQILVIGSLRAVPVLVNQSDGQRVRLAVVKLRRSSLRE